MTSFFLYDFYSRGLLFVRIIVTLFPLKIKLKPPGARCWEYPYADCGPALSLIDSAVSKRI
jgi:hypothetical protein